MHHPSVLITDVIPYIVLSILVVSLAVLVLVIVCCIKFLRK